MNVSGPCSCTMPSSGSCLITRNRNQAICPQNGSCPSIGGRPEGGGDGNHGRKLTYWQGKGNDISFSTGKSPVVAGDAFERHGGDTRGRRQRPEIKGARRNGWDTSVCKHHCLNLKGECTKTSSFHTKRIPLMCDRDAACCRGEKLSAQGWIPSHQAHWGRIVPGLKSF